MGEAQVRFCHAEREIIITKFGVTLDLPVSERRIFYSISAIEPGGYGFNFLLNANIQRIEELKLRGFLSSLDNSLSQSLTSLSSICPDI